jgi:hypothetical protein
MNVLNEVIDYESKNIKLSYIQILQTLWTLNDTSIHVNDDVKLYGLNAKSNQFKTLRRRIVRPIDDSILVELDVEVS